MYIYTLFLTENKTDVLEITSTDYKTLRKCANDWEKNGSNKNSCIVETWKKEM